MKASIEKSNRGLQEQLSEIAKRLAEGQLQLNDMDMSNKKAISENSDLLRQLEDLDSNLSMLQKVKIQLSNQLEDAKRACEEVCQLILICSKKQGPFYDKYNFKSTL